MIAPDVVQGPLLLLGGLMVAVIAFSSVELTLYLLIFSTLLSPELMLGGGAPSGAADHAVTTTASRGITLRLDDMLLTVICLTWLFRMAVYKELGLVRQTPINRPITWYWLVALAATIAGFYAGRVGAFGFFFVIKYLEYFVLFYMIINQINDLDSIKRYLHVMLLTCFIASVLGIAQIPSGLRVSAPFEGAEGEPNTFGGYLVLMFSVALGMFLYARSNKAKLLLGILILSILVPLAFTESRSSYLSFAMAVFLFILFAENKRLIIFVCLVGLTVAPFVLPKNVVDRVMYTFTQAEEHGQINVGGLRIDTSTSERLHAWQDVLSKSFPVHPLLGVGVTGGRFMDAQYPRVLAETGIIGLACFLWFLRRIWVLLREDYRRLRDPVLKGVALGTLCGYGGLLVHAIGANTFIIVRIMEPLMILLGLLLASRLVQQSDSEDVEDANQDRDQELAEQSEHSGLQSQPSV